MHPFKLIKTKNEHRSALSELEGLMETGPAPRSEAADRIELLAMLIENYEKKHFPIAAPDPVEAILFRMEQQGLTRADLVPMIGPKSKVSEILTRKRSLSLSMIKALHQNLSIPAEVLVG